MFIYCYVFFIYSLTFVISYRFAIQITLYAHIAIVREEKYVSVRLLLTDKSER